MDHASNITGKVLVCIGTEDPLIPPDQRADFEKEMRAGGVDWRMNLYGGAAHSFTNPSASAMGVPPERLLSLRQVHSTVVVVVDGEAWVKVPSRLPKPDAPKRS